MNNTDIRDLSDQLGSIPSASRMVPAHVKAAAVEDYNTSGDTKTAVAARHGISRTTLSDALRSNGGGVGYTGGWEVRGGVRYPLLPERRTA